MDNYKQLVEASNAHNSIRADSSVKKFIELVEKRIRTTMIGALDKFEKKFGHWWGNLKDESKLTDNEIKILDMFEDCRKEILDLGNDQIRRIRKEINNFDINIKSYTRRIKNDEQKKF